MGVWGRLASVFGRHEGSGSRLRAGAASVAPEEPIVIKWPPEAKDGGEDQHGGEPAEAPEAGGHANGDEAHDQDGPEIGVEPRHEIVAPASRRAPSRQELIEELRRNYTEVIDLVRKVNTHLDVQGSRHEAQERRAERVVELMEKVPEALAVLPEIREQNARLVELAGRMVEAVEALAAATREGQRSIEGAIIEQARLGRESAERSEALLARSAEAQDRSAAGLSALGQSMGESSERLAGLLRQAQATAGERDAKLAEMISRSQRWLILAIVLCVSAVVVAGAALVLMLT